MEFKYMGGSALFWLIESKWRLKCNIGRRRRTFLKIDLFQLILWKKYNWYVNRLFFWTFFRSKFQLKVGNFLSFSKISLSFLPNSLSFFQKSLEFLVWRLILSVVRSGNLLKKYTNYGIFGALCAKIIGFKHIYRRTAEKEMSCPQISLSFWAMGFFKNV